MQPPSQLESEVQTIKRDLGLDRSPTRIAEEIRQSLEAAPRDGLFASGGLCNGYPLQPLADRYFVAQEFSASRDDLRFALTTALDDFGVRPICADDFLWAGHILCKMSALIQTTPFGVYQLTTSQNRNVYLELGIAIGLGRPFVLVKDRDAQLSPLAQGLDYQPIDSYLELRYSLRDKITPFLAEIAKYRRPNLLSSQDRGGTVVVAHGDIEVIDFCVPLAKMIVENRLVPVILGDPTNKLSDYLRKESVDHQIIGRSGSSRLNDTAAAIHSAQFGVYRIDKLGAPDTFLALGMSIGLNRSGVLVHKSGAEVPSDVKGLSAFEFPSYTDLCRSLPNRLGEMLQR